MEMWKIYSNPDPQRALEPLGHLTRLGTNHPWGEGIQVCSNKGWHPSLRGDNSKSKNIQKIF
jgi:hypothetical protein